MTDNEKSNTRAVEGAPTGEMKLPYVDWQQIVLNGGPPCFAILEEDPTRFCCRAERWEGHGSHHEFVSLDAYFEKWQRFATLECELAFQTGQKSGNEPQSVSPVKLWRDAFDAGVAFAESQWVSVKDRLPDEDGSYEVTIIPFSPYSDVSALPRRVTRRFFKTGQYGEWRVDNGSVSQAEVIAWRPLPAPYIEDK